VEEMHELEEKTPSTSIKKRSCKSKIWYSSLKKLQKTRQDSKKLRRGNTHPNSITKAPKLSRRLLEWTGIVIGRNISEGQEMTPPITEIGLQKGDMEKDMDLRALLIPW
jgi:hypothetical protein